MHFATALPGWTLVVIAAAILALAVFAYRRARGLSTARRSLLVGLRAGSAGAGRALPAEADGADHAGPA